MRYIEVTSNEMYLEIPATFIGNVGIGTTGQYPLHIASKDYKTYGQYSSIAYENYTTWTAYTNRIPLTLTGPENPVNEFGSAIIPDIGFDFYINNTNYRSKIYALATGRIMFGIGDRLSDYYYPQLYAACTGAVQNELSYYIGSYNNQPALYVFFDGYDQADSQKLRKVCVVIQQSEIYLFIQVLNSSAPSGFGLYDINYIALISLPEDSNTNNINITNSAYKLNLFREKYGSGICNEGGNITTTHNIGVGTNNPTVSLQIMGNTELGLGVVSKYPPAEMTANTTTLTNTNLNYGKGVYTASASSFNYFQPYTLFNKNDYFFQGLFMYGTFGSSGNYTGSTSTSFIDFNQTNTSILGEWIQLQFPKPIVLDSYGIKPAFTTSSGPRKCALLGSLNGSTWYLVDDHRTNVITYSSLTQEKVITITPTQTTKFQYYRLVTNAVGSGNYPRVQIDEFAFYVKNPTQVKIYGDTYISGNIGIGTTIPIAKTHIYYTGPGDILRIDDSTAPDVTPFVINQDGNVGIGMSYPSKTLDVNGAVNANNFIGNGASLTSLDAGNITIGTLQIQYGGTGTTSLAANKLLVGNASSSIIQPIELHWDGTNLGIGTETPLAKTHVYCNGTGDILRVDDVNVQDNALLIINQDGNVGIGTTSPFTNFHVHGTIRNTNGPAPTSGTSLVITGDGDIAPQSSDARYKTNVEDIPQILNSLMKIRPVSYNWKDEPEKWCGLLAQDVLGVIPVAAWHNPDNDTYGVHYTPTLVTLLLKGLQELTDKVSELSTRVQELERT